jgi:two-component system, chemotaxis family, chemotaxis protein CheY
VTPVLTMVIDDSRAMRLILKRIVSQVGFDVVEAANGKEAMDYLNASLAGGDKTKMPGLALVDWNMPEMNGLEFVSAVRADERLRGMTLMMVTTESEQSQIVQALAAGAHEYVIKPFTPDAIIDKLTLLGLVTNGVGV